MPNSRNFVEVTRQSMMLITRNYLGAYRFSGLQFLVSLLLLLVTAPLIQDYASGYLIETGLGALVLGSAVLVVGGQRWTLITGMVLVLPVVAARLLRFYQPGPLTDALAPTATFLFLAFVTVQLLRYVLCTPRINADVLYAGISGYFLVAMLWAFAYALINQLSPGAIQGPATSGPAHEPENFDTLYFSFITLNTVGYGDFLPTTKTAKMLAMLESTTGIFYGTVLVARLVSLYTSQQYEERKGENRQG